MSQAKRRAARVDSNQSDIVKQLRRIPGVTVELDHDDILVGFRGRTYWYEIKQPGKEKQLKDSQKRILAEYTGHYRVVSSLGDILKDMGIGG